MENRETGERRYELLRKTRNGKLLHPSLWVVSDGGSVGKPTLLCLTALGRVRGGLLSDPWHGEACDAGYAWVESGCHVMKLE